uniref:WAP four-disulfide core domain protein 2 n=1 Tax=Balaenoptera musculus TaxID=9771 RepID=A0A8C0DHG8_BALMU
MPACRYLSQLIATLLLGLPPLPVRLPGTGAEKSGVCPTLEVDLNCTQECLSDAECADNLKCCRAGCTTVCQMPNGNPGGPTRDIPTPGWIQCSRGGPTSRTHCGDIVLRGQGTSPASWSCRAVLVRGLDPKTWGAHP